MYGLLNLGSFILGIIAWIIPIHILYARKKNTTELWMLSFLSIIFVCMALFMQMIYTWHLVNKNDWSALLDTQGAVIFAAAILMVGAIILNGFILNMVKKRNNNI